MRVVEVIVPFPNLKQASLPQQCLNLLLITMCHSIFPQITIKSLCYQLFVSKDSSCAHFVDVARLVLSGLEVIEDWLAVRFSGFRLQAAAELKGSNEISPFRQLDWCRFDTD